MIYKNFSEFKRKNKSIKKIATINGVFDLFHKGHVDAINQCLSINKDLIILVNSDKSTTRIKGLGRPKEKLNKRLNNINHRFNSCHIIPFFELTPVKVLQKINPITHFYSDDWGEDLVEKIYLKNTEFSKIRKNIDISTSKLLKQKESKNNKAVILDRDGTITVDKLYKNNISNLTYKEGSIEGLKILRNEGYKLFVVSNQSGVARGLIDKKTVLQFNNKIKSDLLKDGIYIEKFYTSFSLKNSSIYRKPNNKFIELISDNFEVALKDSWVIGDKDSDILFGKLSNCKTVRISSDYSQKISPNIKSSTLLDAAKKIIRYS